MCGIVALKDVINLHFKLKSIPVCPVKASYFMYKTIKIKLYLGPQNLIFSKGSQQDYQHEI